VGPYLLLMDPDPDPAIFFSDLQGVNKKLFFFFKFFCLLFFEGPTGPFLHHFLKKSHKEVTKQYESMFFLFFCLMIEGSGSVALSLTNGSGSGGPQKHMDPVDPDSDPDPQY
jgi:hypothetical protein